MEHNRYYLTQCNAAALPALFNDILKTGILVTKIEWWIKNLKPYPLLLSNSLMRDI